MAIKRILIIDDEDDIREVAQLSLEMLVKWEIFTASSGEEGLTKAIEFQPDAILLDVMMPGKDGPATLIMLQQEPLTQHIPVIFLTAKTQSKEQISFAQMGVKAVITKPFDPLNLADQITQALGW